MQATLSAAGVVLSALLAKLTGLAAVTVSPLLCVTALWVDLKGHSDHHITSDRQIPRRQESTKLQDIFKYRTVFS